MVIRLDSNRVKDLVNNNTELIGVDGDPHTKVAGGVSEADKIVEQAQQSIVSSGLADNPAAAEKANEETLQRMASENHKQEPGPEMSIKESDDLPSVDILSPNRSPDNPSSLAQ
jgi:protein phosphatase PTC1